MVAWMLVVFGLSGFSVAGGGQAAAPQPIGQGVTVTPASGWSLAGNAKNAGTNVVSFQRAGVRVIFAADTYTGTSAQLLDQQLSDARSQLSSFRSLPAGSTTVAGGIDGLKVLFSGVGTSSNLEGELAVAVSSGVGVVMLAVGPPGQIGRVQSDLDSMLEGISLP